MDALIRQIVLVRAASRLADGVFSLRLVAPDLARIIEPGQFLGVKTGPGLLPLLRRPISVADVVGHQMRLVYRVVGLGTELLSRIREGDELDVLGPLGRPAPFLGAAGQGDKPKTGKLMVCGGGVGAAPLLFYTRRLRRLGDVSVFLGARSRRQLILLREFNSLGVPVKVATDDGSSGHYGTVTELVETAVENEVRTVVVACGPKGMLRDLVRKLDPIPVWGFIEEMMGCGTGICYCCALPKRGGGYVRFCREGPVVLLNEVEL